ncbi:MAG: hypothetical protein HC898_04820 [Phycisphaerales bacterium]|nr:hypothetical protein [Phycisphaerales bacterium]
MLAQAIITLEQAGHCVILHVHDEVVIECPQAQADQAEAQVKQILETVPAWLAGCPLKVETQQAERYQK